MEATHSPRLPSRRLKLAWVALWLAVLAPGALAGSAPQPRGRVHVPEASPPVTFTVELARTSRQHYRGLMYRESLKPRHGMLFVYPRPHIVHMWMKNTQIPLDVLFIASQGEIVHMKRQAQPHDTTPFSSRYPVRYVLEIEAGSIRRYAIKVGQRVRVTLPETAGTPES